MPVSFLLDRLLRRERLDRSIEEELQAHIAERAADLQRSGVPAVEAERRAKLELLPGSEQSCSE